MVGLEFNDALDLTAIGTLALAVVTVPVADHREMDFAGRSPRVRPRFRPTAPGIPEGRMVVPIENIGTGPALHIEARAELLKADGKPSEVGGQPASISSVALGTSMLGVTELDTERWAGKVPFGLTLTYGDVAGSRWQTTAKYLIDPREHGSEGRYEGLEIERMPPASSKPSEPPSDQTAGAARRPAE
jgi:hypothetical protein